MNVATDMGTTLDIPSLKDKVSAREWQTRVDLAAAYRLVALNGWDDLIYTHISARIPESDHHFLLNPLGLLFEEITASSLVKVDLSGNTLMESPFKVNKAGFVIHSAVHAARKDAQCVLHLHTDYGIAVSNQKDGLLPLCQSAIFPWGTLSYHDYEGIAVRDGEKERFVSDLGSNQAMILRNHGTLTVGASIPKAYELMAFLEKSCRIQILSQAGNKSLVMPSDQSVKNALSDLRLVAGADGADQLLWPALLRKLDRICPDYRQ